MKRTGFVLNSMVCGTLLLQLGYDVSNWQFWATIIAVFVGGCLIEEGSRSAVQKGQP